MAPDDFPRLLELMTGYDPSHGDSAAVSIGGRRSGLYELAEDRRIRCWRLPPDLRAFDALWLTEPA